MKYRSVDRITPEHVGHRVTVRRRLPEGSLSDVIGVLEHADETTLTVRNARGERLEIARTDVVAARVVQAVRTPRDPAPG